MATDIVLDDGAADTITLHCNTIASGGDLALDRDSARSNAAPGRVALRHASGDQLRINPVRDYPGGVNLQVADINLRMHEQTDYPPKLPARGDSGDMLFIHSRSRHGRRTAEHYTLWLCCGQAADGAAMWYQIPLLNPVIGTL